MADRSLLQINPDWRIATDDRLQWILQRRAGQSWQGQRFHMERDALLRSVLELAKPVELEGVYAVVASWPRFFQPRCGMANIATAEAA